MVSCSPVRLIAPPIALACEKATAISPSSLKNAYHAPCFINSANQMKLSIIHSG